MSKDLLYIAFCSEFRHKDLGLPLYKIGVTQQGIHERMKTLGSETGVPGAYICLYYFECENCYKTEDIVHEILGDLRYKQNKEFFFATLERIVLLLKQLPGTLFKFDEMPFKQIRKKPRKKPTPEPTQEQKDKIVRYHKRKRTQEDISKITKVSLHHVSKTIKQYETDIATFKMQGRIER
jgi:hypothetical protein